MTNSTHYETYRCRKLTTSIEGGAAEGGGAAQARPLAQLEGGVAAQLRPLAQPVGGGRIQHGELVEMSRYIFFYRTLKLLVITVWLEFYYNQEQVLRRLFDKFDYLVFAKIENFFYFVYFAKDWMTIW